MNVKIKSFLFTTFLVISLGLKAQDAGGGYEYAEVTFGYDVAELPVLILYSDREKETIPTGFKPYKYRDHDLHEAILKAVGVKAKEGWSVINATNSTSGVNNTTYFLRRKKQ